MDLRVDIVTLAVPDLDEAHAFYVDRLRWHPALVIPGEVTFLLAGPGRMIGLFGRRDLERDIGDHERVPPFDLGQLFNTPAEVDTAVEAMVWHQWSATIGWWFPASVLWYKTDCPASLKPLHTAVI
jgi:catechol 2,3-dioxygenase-like lactoylglutathione lyase family enzyme